MSIVKAEILWSRLCGLSCPYCSMATGKRACKSEYLWLEGVKNLKNLNCGFVAIYGAEPLDDFDVLPEFVEALSKAKIANTLITSCYRQDTKEKLNILFQYGLRSLTVSYDGSEKYDPSSTRKTNRGLEHLRWFKDKYQDKAKIDAAVCMTINRKNIDEVIPTVHMMNELDIWTLFDFIHPDRGQKGSKCKNTEYTKELLFTEEDLPKIVRVLTKVQLLKKDGCKIHWSDELLQQTIDRPEVLIKYDWHCVDKNFPSWLTVDCTGEVYCCDDFQIKNNTRKWYFWDIEDQLGAFAKYWKEATKKECPGCFWNTHRDANLISAGKASLDAYKHFQEV